MEAVSLSASSTACHLADKDLQATRKEYVFTLPANALNAIIKQGLLRDERDAPLALLLCNILLTALPAAALLHICRVESHALGLLFLVTNYVLYLQRFLLTLHFSEHRPLFRPACLNLLAPYVLAPLYGVPPGAYRLHHVIMHHTEDNAAGWDLSATEGYQRDSLAAFLRYWLRFACLGVFELPLYGLRRQRYTEAATAAASMAGGAAVTLLLWRRCWVATLYSLVLPYWISSLALMFGNWSQHIFVDPSSPCDDYSLTYNCLACPDNARTYNDGYHIQHHANSTMHWSELPAAFKSQLQRHDDKDALVFSGIGVFDVGCAVMAGRLEWLAGHLVPCGPRQVQRSRQDWVDVLRRRLQAVARGARKH